MKLSEYIASNEITFQQRDLPVGIRGFTYHDDEGRYIVVLNSRLGIMMNRRTADHEMLHILRNDSTNLNYKEYE